jgi:hypothetical protein
MDKIMEKHIQNVSVKSQYLFNRSMVKKTPLRAWTYRLRAEPPLPTFPEPLHTTLILKSSTRF